MWNVCHLCLMHILYTSHEFNLVKVNLRLSLLYRVRNTHHKMSYTLYDLVYNVIYHITWRYISVEWRLFLGGHCNMQVPKKYTEHVLLSWIARYFSSKFISEKKRTNELSKLSHVSNSFLERTFNRVFYRVSCKKILLLEIFCIQF